MMPVRLEPAALRSRVKHSTTEPLRSQYDDQQTSSIKNGCYTCQRLDIVGRMDGQMLKTHIYIFHFHDEDKDMGTGQY